jgi:putative transposase
MPWKETGPMPGTPAVPGCVPEPRVLHDRAVRERFGLSRNTGPTWVRHDPAPGLAGRPEKSRAPHRCPHRLAAQGAALLWDAKRAPPPWGPRPILPYLARRRPTLELPAPSTAGELFQRAGLRQARQRRRGHRHPGALPLQAAASPAVWTAVCKGQCRPGDGLSSSPLTVADAYRRVL